MKVVVRDIGEEIDDLLKKEMQTLLEEEKKRREKDWKDAAEYFSARYIEAEAIRKMMKDFFAGESS